MLDISKVYTDHKQRVSSLVNFKVKDKSDAQEVTNDVFIKLMKLEDKESTRFDASKSALTTHIHKIANSVIIDFYRTNHQDHYTAVSDLKNDESGKNLFDFEAPRMSNADDRILRFEFKYKLANAFRMIKNEKQKKVGVLYFVKGLPYAEIAKMLDMPLNSVKGCLTRVRAVLTTQMSNDKVFA